MKKVNFFTFFKLFRLWTAMVPIHGTGIFFQYLGHYLQSIPSTFTRIKILILCTILLCSVKHILIKQKTTNEYYHSNQSPILKFSPSNCLHFLNILPSADINHFWALKPFTPMPLFHHVGHIGFVPIKTHKIKNLFFWHFGHKLQPKSKWKKQTWPKLNK